MTMAAASIALEDAVERAELRVYCGTAITEGDVLVSCIVDTPDKENLEISKWPKYHKNGLPSKFLKASDGRNLQRLTDLSLPCAEDRTLRLILSSDTIHNWSDWVALLLAKEHDSPFPILWALKFGGNK